MAKRQHYYHINWANEALVNIITNVVSGSEERIEPVREIVNDVVRWSMKPRLLSTLGVRIKLCNSQIIFKNMLENLRQRLQDLETVKELEEQEPTVEKEDNLPDGWKEFDDGDQPTTSKRKRGNEDSYEGEFNYIKKVRCEGGCPSEQNKTTKSKKNNKKQNIQTNKPGLSCFQMDIDVFPETDIDDKCGWKSDC